MGEKRGTKALELWCKIMVEDRIAINNMTTSWKNGLAFCALVSKCSSLIEIPDFINFNALKEEDAYHNNELAFSVAEKYLNIPSLLDPSDMTKLDIPDKLSILTYLSQFYQLFGKLAEESNENSLKVNKLSSSSTSSSTTSSTTETNSSKMANVIATKREPASCRKCQQKIFFAEKIVVNDFQYHRSCFRCARCNTILKFGYFYETENDQEFCCEICPDEEKSSSTKIESSSNRLSIAEKIALFEKDSVLKKSLSDEEKSKSLKGQTPTTSFLSSQIAESSDDEDDEKNVTSSDSDSDDDKLNITNHKFVPEKPELEHDKDKVAGAIAEEAQNPFKSQDYNLDDNKVKTVPDDIDDIESEFDKIVEEAEKSISIDVLDKNDEKIENVVTVEKKFESNEKIETKIVEDEEILKEFSFETDENSVIGGQTNSQKTSNDLECFEIQSDETAEQPEVNDIPRIQIEPSVTIELENNLISNTNSNVEKAFENVNSSIEEPHKNNEVKSFETLQTEVILKKEDNLIEKSTKQKQKNLNTYPLNLNPFGDEENLSKNPFGSEDEDERENTTGTLPKNLKASTNPFGSDEEEEESREILHKTPIPTPRRLIQSATPEPSPRSLSNHNSPGHSFKGSTSSLASSNDGMSLRRKKKAPAPPPPSKTPSTTPRKKRPAPTPPSSIAKSIPEPEPSYFLENSENVSNVSGGKEIDTHTESFDNGLPLDEAVSTTPRRLIPLEESLVLEEKAPQDKEEVFYRRKIVPLSPSASESLENLERSKDNKEAQNRQRQSQGSMAKTESESTDSLAYVDKSLKGKWKRKKGPAPSIPNFSTPQRRILQMLPLQEIRQELDVIELQQQGLEKQGVILEKMIRERCEGSGDNRTTEELLESLPNPKAKNPKEVEELILQLFELVNEKNELFRRQAELMYLRRAHRLEEEQADVEYEIRTLMAQPEQNKTDSDKTKEEALIARLVEIVQLRNEVVDCLDRDRLREREEDFSIKQRMESHTSKLDQDYLNQTPTKLSKKEKKKLKEKLKNKKLDADKDLDTSEMKSETSEKKKKKKKFLF